MITYTLSARGMLWGAESGRNPQKHPGVTVHFQDHARLTSISHPIWKQGYVCVKPTRHHSCTGPARLDAKNKKPRVIFSPSQLS